MSKLDETVGQTIVDGLLRWGRSGLDSNGVPFEEDGIGFPPEYIRRQLIKEQGEWEVIVDGSVNRMAVARVLKESIQLDLASTAKLVKGLPGIAYSGTKVEASWVREQLQEIGVSVEVRRAC